MSEEKKTTEKKEKNVEIKPGMTIKVTAEAAPDGVNTTFDTKLRIDTMPEVGYFRNGGILQTVVRDLPVEEEEEEGTA